MRCLFFGGWGRGGLVLTYSRAGNIPINDDVTGVLTRFRHIVGELHAQQMVHLRPKRLFDAQHHFRCERGFAVKKIGERGAADFQNLRRLGYVEAEGFDDFGSDQVTRMGRVFHRHFGSPNGSQSNLYG